MSEAKPEPDKRTDERNGGQLGSWNKNSLLKNWSTKSANEQASDRSKYELK